MSERPWSLEVWEVNLDTTEMEWRMWSTYRAERNAVERRDHLISKGIEARVMNVDTGDASPVSAGPVVCHHCGEAHPAPFDGGCLL